MSERATRAKAAMATKNREVCIVEFATRKSRGIGELSKSEISAERTVRLVKNV